MPGIAAQTARRFSLGTERYVAARSAALRCSAPIFSVRREVADAEAFRTVAKHGTARARPGLAHRVRVALHERPLSRRYGCRLFPGEAVSATGRARTPDAAREPLRFARA